MLALLYFDKMALFCWVDNLFTCGITADNIFTCGIIKDSNHNFILMDYNIHLRSNNIDQIVLISDDKGQVSSWQLCMASVS